MNKLSYKKRIAILSIVTALFVSLPACAIGEKPSDFTGDSFFTSPIMDSNENFIPLDDNNNDAEQKKLDNPNKTIPPIKMLRLKAKAFYFKRKDLKEQKMNPQPIQVVEDNQEEQYNLDSDNIKAKEKRKKQAEAAEQTQNCHPRKNGSHTDDHQPDRLRTGTFRRCRFRKAAARRRHIYRTKDSAAASRSDLQPEIPARTSPCGYPSAG